MSNDSILEEALLVVAAHEQKHGALPPTRVHALLIEKLGPEWAHAAVTEYDLQDDQMRLWICTLVSIKDEHSKLVHIIPVIGVGDEMVFLSLMKH